MDGELHAFVVFGKPQLARQRSRVDAIDLERACNRAQHAAVLHEAVGLGDDADWHVAIRMVIGNPDNDVPARMIGAERDEAGCDAEGPPLEVRDVRQQLLDRAHVDVQRRREPCVVAMDGCRVAEHNGIGIAHEAEMAGAHDSGYGGRLTVGAGVRMSEVLVKLVSTTTGGTQEARWPDSRRFIS